MELYPDYEMDLEGFEATFRRFAALVDRSLEDELKNQGRLWIIDAIKVTPPFHQGVGQGVSAAKKAGEQSIGRNMDKIFIPRDLVGTRKITHLFGRTDVPGLPYIVPAPELYPDVEGMYRAEKARAKQRALRGMRFFGPERRVSKRKVQKIYRAEVKKVGFLAGGWNEVARALGVTAKVPAFVRRHNSAPGRVRLTFTKEMMSIYMANEVSYADTVGGMYRRVQSATKKRVAAMRKQIPYLVRKAERVL